MLNGAGSSLPTDWLVSHSGASLGFCWDPVLTPEPAGGRTWGWGRRDWGRLGYATQGGSGVPQRGIWHRGKGWAQLSPLQVPWAQYSGIGTCLSLLCLCMTPALHVCGAQGQGLGPGDAQQFPRGPSAAPLAQSPPGYPNPWHSPRGWHALGIFYHLLCIA